MKKRCAYCTGLNEPTQMVCTSCGLDLTYAEEVYDSAADPAPASGSAADPPSAPEFPCRCRAGQALPGTNRCLFCDGRIEDREPAPAPPLRPRPVARPRITLEMAGGIRTALDAGLLIGRDPRAAHSALAAALAAFPGVSRLHAWIGQEEGQIVLVDLGSRNGTWVNGTRLTPAMPHRITMEELPARLRLGGRCETSLIVEEMA